MSLGVVQTTVLIFSLGCFAGTLINASPQKKLLIILTLRSRLKLSSLMKFEFLTNWSFMPKRAMKS